MNLRGTNIYSQTLVNCVAIAQQYNDKQTDQTESIELTKYIRRRGLSTGKCVLFSKSEISRLGRWTNEQRRRQKAARTVFSAPYGYLGNPQLLVYVTASSNSTPLTRLLYGILLKGGRALFLTRSTSPTNVSTCTSFYVFY